MAYAEIEAKLQARLAELFERVGDIEDELRSPLEADSEEQAQNLADDEALEGVDDVLQSEIAQVRNALTRIANGTYGTCPACGEPIARERLAAMPTATRCIKCA